MRNYWMMTCGMLAGLLMQQAAAAELSQSTRLGAERVPVGRVGLGVVVRSDAPMPDIASVESLKQALLRSESLVFNRASTGIYFEGMLRKMGIWSELEARTTRYPDGASVLEHVLHGKGREIGFGAITEILLYRDKGLKLVGPLPAEVQNYTRYSGTPSWVARESHKQRRALCAISVARWGAACLLQPASSPEAEMAF